MNWRGCNLDICVHLFDDCSLFCRQNHKRSGTEIKTYLRKLSVECNKIFDFINETTCVCSKVVVAEPWLAITMNIPSYYFTIVLDFGIKIFFFLDIYLDPLHVFYILSSTERPTFPRDANVNHIDYKVPCILAIVISPSESTSNDACSTESTGGTVTCARGVDPATGGAAAWAPGANPSTDGAAA